MGSCTSSNKIVKSPLPSRSRDDKAHLWSTVQSFNFDGNNFNFAQTLQENLTQVNGSFVSQDLVGSLVLEFKRLLFLQMIQIKFVPHLGKLVPSPLLNRVWLAALRNPLKYQQFCLFVCGTVIEKPSLQACSLSAYNKTVRFYQKEFGEPDKRVWPLFDSANKLAEAYEGFFYLDMNQFMSFHVEFTKKYENFVDLEQSGKVIKQELTRFKKTHRLKLIPMEQLRTSRRDHYYSPLKRAKRGKGKHFGEPTERFNEEEGNYFNIVTTRKEVVEQLEGRESRVLHASQIRVNISQGSLHFLEKIEEKTEMFPSLKHYSNNLEPLPLTPPIDSEREEREEEDQCFSQGDDIFEDELELKEEIPKVRRRSELQLVSLKSMKQFQHDFLTEQALTRLVFKEYKRFLVLYFFFRDETIPSPLVEWAWSYHLTDYHNYSNLCSHCFNHVLRPFFLPAGKDAGVMEKYSLTLERYRKVFEEVPHPQVWPDVKSRFNYDEIYSRKFFNIYGYMEEMLERRSDGITGNRSTQQGSTEREFGMRKRALAGMRTLKEPQRGANHLVFVSVDKNSPE